jgi:intein/homing endonuclease
MNIIDNRKKPQTIAQLDWVYEKFEGVIDMLDEKSLLEISGGYQSDIDTLINKVKKSVVKSFSGVPEEITNNHFFSLTNLTANIHETLKILNYNYFKLTMLPDFFVSEHSGEWGNIVQLYPRTCLLASRGLGKTFEHSNALPIWKLYGYHRPTLLNPIDRKTKLRRQGLIITNSFSLGKKILSDISKEIKNNPALHEKLKPESKNEGSLGKEYIETSNGGEIHLRSASSSSRGLHPGWVVVDDYGDNNWIYSQEQRQKAIDFFYGDIMKTLERGSTINVIGCVSPSTVVITKNGLKRIGDLCPVDSYKEKGLHEFELDVLGKDGWNTTSHYWCNGLTKTKKITLRGGYNLECSLIHPLWVMGEDGVPNWVESKDLKVGDWVGIKLNQDFEGEKIKLDNFYSNYNFTHNQKRLSLGSYVDRDLAYLIGIYTADGNFGDNGKLRITKGNKGIREFLFSYGFKKAQGIKMDFNSKYLKDVFGYLGCEFGTAIDKNFPKKIFEADKETIKWFLQGMFDGDGNCYIDKDMSIQISYSSISSQLVYDLQKILMVFGIFSSVTVRPPGISELVEGKNDLYFLRMTGYDSKNFLNEVGFRFSGKSNKITYEILNKSKLSKSSYRRVPHQKDLIKKVRKEKPRRKRGLVSTLPPFHSEEVLSKTISKESLKVACDWFVENKAEGEATDQLIKNSNEDLIYLLITEIENNESYTVDFHIPDGHNFITNCVSSHNTPFHETDLYAHIRENDKTFKYFEYPAVMPDGTIVAPHRWNMQELEDEYETNGPLIFSRELLVVPISDGSTIFPWEMLRKAFIGMQDYRLVQNRDSFPIKFKFVSVGCDFARSANIGSDSTVFTVWGIDDFDNYWLLHIWRKLGAEYNEQIAKLKEIERNFRPDEIIAESNGFQKIMIDIGRDHGIKNLTDFNTDGWNKKDLYEGLPSLAILFNQGRIRLPRGDQYSNEMTDLMCTEFNSITIKPQTGKLESAGTHDDTVLSAWFAIKCISVQKNKDINFVMV